MDAEWALADKKLKAVTQYASRLHADAQRSSQRGLATSQQRSFKPVRKAIIAAREAYLRLLNEPWLPHRRKTLGRLKALDRNPMLHPPDPVLEFDEAVKCLGEVYCSPLMLCGSIVTGVPSN